MHCLHNEFAFSMHLLNHLIQFFSYFKITFSHFPTQNDSSQMIHLADAKIFDLFHLAHSYQFDNLVVKPVQLFG